MRSSPSIGVMASDRARAVKALRATPAGELARRRAELQAAAEAAGLTLAEIGKVLNSRPKRPLEAEERAVLLAVLRHAEFEGRDALLAQVKASSVVGYCECGCASVSLAVDPSAPPAHAASSPLPNEAEVLGPDEGCVGGVLIFLTHGYLSYLEVYDHGERISPFPPLERLEITSTSR